MNKSITFGIMIPCNQIPIWQEQTIMRLLSLKNVELKLIILDENKHTFYSKFQRFFSFNTFLWYTFLVLNHFRFKSLKKINIQYLLDKTNIIYCNTFRRGKFSEYFFEKDIETIKEYNLDFILRFGFNIIRGEILNVTKYGIWSFHHDDETKYRGGPPCFWEVYNNDPVTAGILQKLTNRLDGGVVLKKGYLKTKNSYFENRDQLYFESASWPEYLCKQIQYGSININEMNPSKTLAPIYSAPKNFQFIFFTLKQSIRKLKSFFKTLFFIDIWNIGVWQYPIDYCLTKEIDESKIHWYQLNKKSFSADPFGVIDKEKKIRVFFEKFQFGKKKGCLNCIEYLPQEGFINEKEILKTNYHLSYPFTFKHNDDWYLIPESYCANSIDLFRSDSFPHNWTKHKTLVKNFSGIDNTVIYWNNSFWLFTSDKNNGPRFNLMVFYSNDLMGEWTPHPLNPVKTDIRSARCAGTPFIYNGELYRPSMDYSIKIEGQITINKISKLTFTEFEEDYVKTIKPISNSSFPDKIHTISKVGNFTLIDGCKESFILKNAHYIRHQIQLILKFIFRHY